MSHEVTTNFCLVVIEAYMHDTKGSEHLPAGDCHKPLHSIVQPHRAYQDPW